MSKTLIGQLIIKLVASGFRETAAQATSSLDSIDQRVRRMGTGAGWGSGFQRQLDRLKLSPAQLAAVRQSWEKIPTTINGALKRDFVANWKNNVLSHFAQVESGAKSLRQNLRDTLGSAILSGALGYGAVTLGREGVVAGAERDRAYLRMDQAGIPKAEQGKFASSAEALSAKYPGMSMTDIMELALRARSTMGDGDRTIAILEDLVKGQIVSMSVRDPSTGQSIMDRIVKAGDVLGLNASGPGGIADMRQMVDGLIRAAQVEGLDFDPGGILEFARRGKVAGAGWSTDFVSSTAPVLMQDQGAGPAGNALAMFDKSFVQGDNSMNGKIYKARQKALGIRDDNGLIGKELASSDPYEWTKQYLLPALVKAGVDINDDVALKNALAPLSGNSNATASLTRMVQQRDQIEKSRLQYHNAMGLAGAKDVNERDPFVAWEGFKNSFSNFAGAIAENANIITPGLGLITGAINQLAAATRDDPLKAVGVGTAALGLGGLGIWKIGGAFSGLMTAGPSLQTAAVMLQDAAGRLGASNGLGGVGGGAKGKGVLGGPGLGTLIFGLSNIFSIASDWTKFQDALGKDGGKDWTARRDANDAAANTWLKGLGVGGFKPFQAFDDLSNWAHSSGGEAPNSPYENLRAGGLQTALNPDITSPQVDTTHIDTASGKATTLQQALAGLNMLIAPQFNFQAIEAYLTKLREAATLYGKLGAAPGDGSTIGSLNGFSDGAYQP